MDSYSKYKAKLYKIRCTKCKAYFVKKVIAGMEFRLLCPKCLSVDDYKIPLKNEKQNKRMFQASEQFDFMADVLIDANLKL